jgi:SnoaL-like domain
MRGDGGASPQLAFDDAEDAALLAGDKDPSRRRRIMTAISLVDVGALDLSSGEALLISLADAFNAHDLDRIMSHFADDAVLEMPRGKDSWGGPVCREGCSARRTRRTIQGMPDVHCGDETHFVAADTGDFEVDCHRDESGGKKDPGEWLQF